MAGMNPMRGARLFGKKAEAAEEATEGANAPVPHMGGNPSNFSSKPLVQETVMPAKNWIQNAVNPTHKGLFGAAAAKHGMSTAGFANTVTANPDNYDPTTVKRANFAKTMRGITNKLKKGA